MEERWKKNEVAGKIDKEGISNVVEGNVEIIKAGTEITNMGVSDSVVIGKTGTVKEHVRGKDNGFDTFLKEKSITSDRDAQ